MITILYDQFNTIRVQSMLVECLEVRRHLLRTGYASKSEYEKNETDLLEIKTTIQINSLNQALAENEAFFRDTFSEFISLSE
jgi:ribulose bisphosphate carboxylase small subunit